MASIEEVVAACRETGLPVSSTRYEDDAADKGPHIVVRHEGTGVVWAGDRVYARVDQWSATLYSELFEPSLEESVERALDAAGLPAGDSMSGYDAEHRVHWCEWGFETLRRADPPHEEARARPGGPSTS